MQQLAGLVTVKDVEVVTPQVIVSSLEINYHKGNKPSINKFKKYLQNRKIVPDINHLFVMAPF